jgi:hypothetical protein
LAAKRIVDENMAKVQAKMEEAVTQAGQARKSVLRLQVHDMGSEFAKQFTIHADVLEKAFQYLQEMKVNQKIEDFSQYEPILDRLQKRLGWFEPRLKVRTATKYLAPKHLICFCFMKSLNVSLPHLPPPPPPSPPEGKDGRGQTGERSIQRLHEAKTNEMFGAKCLVAVLTRWHNPCASSWAKQGALMVMVARGKRTPSRPHRLPIPKSYRSDRGRHHHKGHGDIRGRHRL